MGEPRSDGGADGDVSGESVTILAERAEDLDSADVASLKERAASASTMEADFLKAVIAATPHILLHTPLHTTGHRGRTP